MNRLDLDPVNQLATMLKQAEDDIAQIKNRQRYSGVAGLRGYFVQTSNTWDISSSASNGGGDPGYREFQIIFVSSGKQPFPVENVQLDIRFGGTGEANKPIELPNGFWGYDDGVNFAGMFDRNPQFDKSYSNNETTYRWTFGFNVFGTLTYFIKVYAAGTSDGTISVNQTAPQVIIMDEKRVNLANRQDLQNRVAAAIKDMRELKQSQFIGGDSMLFYRKDSGNTFDWGGIPPQSPQAAYVSTKILRVTATALTQNVLFADLIAEQRINSPTAARHTILNYIDEIYAGVDYFSISIYADAQEVNKENIQSWTVVLNGGDWDGISRPLNLQYMKAYVIANDDVQIAVTELN